MAEPLRASGRARQGLCLRNAALDRYAERAVLGDVQRALAVGYGAYVGVLVFEQRFEHLRPVQHVDHLDGGQTAVLADGRVDPYFLPVAERRRKPARRLVPAQHQRLDEAGQQGRVRDLELPTRDIARQRAALKQAEAALKLARIQLDDAALVAPQAGVVLTRAREAGAIVQAGQAVYTLSLVDPVWVRAYVGQNDLGRIKPGMAVMLEVDAAPGKRYPGTVGFVSPTAEFTPKSVETRDVRSALVYRLRVQAMDPDNVMRQGMPITVHVPLTP